MGSICDGADLAGVGDRGWILAPIAVLSASRGVLCSGAMLHSNAELLWYSSL